MRDDFDDVAGDECRSYCDCRYNQMLPMGSEPSVDISTQLINQRIDRIHCDLLERATNGRLTWQGDRIVSTNMQLRQRESAVQIIRRQIEKLKAQRAIRESHAQCSDRPIASPTPAASAKSRCDADTLDCPVEQH